MYCYQPFSSSCSPSTHSFRHVNTSSFGPHHTFFQEGRTSILSRRGRSFRQRARLLHIQDHARFRSGQISRSASQNSGGCLIFLLSSTTGGKRRCSSSCLQTKSRTSIGVNQRIGCARVAASFLASFRSVISIVVSYRKRRYIPHGWPHFADSARD